MRSRTPNTVRRSAAVVLVSAALVLTGCGSDDDDAGKSNDKDTTESSSETTAVEVSEDLQEYCDIVQEAVTADESENLEYLDKQIEVAPPEVEADYELVKEWMELQADPEADALDVAAAEQDGTPAFQRIVIFVQNECGITVDLSGG